MLMLKAFAGISFEFHLQAKKAALSDKGLEAVVKKRADDFYNLILQVSQLLLFMTCCIDG